VKYQAVEKYQGEYPVDRMCKVLGVSASGYYNWQKRVPSKHACEDARLTQQITAIWHSNRRCYGRPRIHAELKAQGIHVGPKRVARLMKQAHITAKRSKRRKPRTTIANDEHPVFANRLARDFTATAPNQKWMSDITYIETNEGFLYLAGILDLFSRKMVGIAMADHMQTDLVAAALHMAWCERQAPAGVLHHSDRGSQFTSDRYLDLLEAYGMTISMSRKGNCWDAAPIESFWGTLKAECATASFDTRQQARNEIFSYIMGFYNRTRRHSALGYLSPEQFELAFPR
jgi:putative transposase